MAWDLPNRRTADAPSLIQAFELFHPSAYGNRASGLSPIVFRGAWIALTMQVHQQQGNRCGRDAADAARLPQCCRTHMFQLARNLSRQSAHVVVVEVIGNRRGLVAALAFDLLALAIEVTRVFRLHLDLRGNLL